METCRSPLETSSASRADLLHYLPLFPIGSGGNGGHARTLCDAWKLKTEFEAAFPKLQYVVERVFQQMGVGFVRAFPSS